MLTGFQFVVSPDGSLEGINDAGIETFAGHRLSSLAREQGQNSLDAKLSSSSAPVQICYSLESIKLKDFPGAVELAQSVDRAINYWSESSRKDNKTIRVLQKAKRMLARDTIAMLRISDRNTTGLRDSDKVEQGDWFSLTKASGVSLKGEGAMGSFGIGKNVFWLNSGVRTVFFATRDVDSKEAFQGVTKLVSHPTEAKTTGRRQLTRSIGFFGEVDGYLPIRKREAIPGFFRLSEVGTDIIVAGFDAPNRWEHELVAAFAMNFFSAFVHDSLVVRIGEHEISQATIGPIIEKLYLEDSESFTELRDYYDCLTRPEAKQFEETLPHIGKARLRLMLRDGARKTIAMFRATGMMIYEQGHFRTPLEFTGVCICDDPEGNKFLRKLEPPSHAAWEPERFEEDPRAAKEAIGALKRWMRKCVQELYPEVGTSAVDIPDLEKYLPDEEEEESLDSPSGEAEGDPVSQKVALLEGRTRKTRSPGREAAEEQGAGEDEGESSGTRSNTSSGGDRGTKGGPSASETEVDVPVRVFLDPDSKGRYLIRGLVPSKGEYSIYLYAIGDDGRRDPVQIERPRAQDEVEKWQAIPRKGVNGIGPLHIDEQLALRIDFQVSNGIPLTLAAKVTRHGS